MENRQATKYEFSEEALSQLSAAVTQAALLNEFKRIEEKIDEVIRRIDQLNVGQSDEIMNKKQACEYLKVSYNNFQKLIRKGLKVTQVDQTIRIKKSDIDDFMAKNQYLKNI